MSGNPIHLRLTMVVFFVFVIRSCIHTTSGGIEDWLTMKNQCEVDKQAVESLWHVPNERELLFVNEILDAHLKNPLDCLEKISTGKKEEYKSKRAG